MHIKQQEVNRASRKNNTAKNTSEHFVTSKSTDILYFFMGLLVVGLVAFIQSGGHKTK